MQHATATHFSLYIRGSPEFAEFWSFFKHYRHFQSRLTTPAAKKNGRVVPFIDLASTPDPFQITLHVRETEIVGGEYPPP